MNRGTISQLQAIESDGEGNWRPVQAPLNGFRLRMNLRYIYHVGYTEASQVPEMTIRTVGYEGAISLKNGTATYLYR